MKTFWSRRPLPESELSARAQEIRELFAEGLTQIQIGERLGLSRATVQRGFRHAGLRSRAGGRPLYTKQQANRAIELYLSGRSMLQVEQLIHVDDQAIKRILVANSVPIREESIKPDYPPELRQLAIDQYISGASAIAVAKALDLKSFTVKQWAKEDGVSRSMSEAQALRLLNGGVMGCTKWKFHHQSTKTGESVLADSSYEAARMEQLDADPSVLLWHRCRDRIPYLAPDGKFRNYVPDFLVQRTTGPVCVEEIKPSTRVDEPKNLAKANAARAHYEGQGVNYVIITEQDIGIELIKDVMRRGVRFIQTRERQRAMWRRKAARRRAARDAEYGQGSLLA